ncbi:MFS transporter [Agrobacterium tumefaciens]|uniref:MFS transporter n=2 Tax=Agrobacterium tumefaciens TaxID=358 RepID=A0AAP9E5F7_AGRTU|nr:MFS transporter [Agrobacterium tumefaciens]NSZ57033.1 MFS transporter [Agrobacterium tumefaciens]QDY95333.1 MFS transporter [Agrobacterium tumefaciens]UXS50458.1 MFS transporter [Agrobacterium tumefaciens]UXS71709.1 MFS transporter [Agrobacterium tumefaciens]UXS79377.1 MFS transporter [Agrobacterium tumefaciens]
MAEKNGWSELLSGANLSLLTVISSGIGLHAFNQFAVVTALPVAVNEIGGAGFYSWAYSLYFVGSVAGGVTAVLFRERFGARTVLLLCCLIFSFGSVLSAIAGDFLWVVVGRALQGLADGLIVAVCYSLIPAGFRSGLLPKVFAIEAAIWAVASFIGPLTGGFATEHISWRATFLLSAPLILLLLAYTTIAVSAERPVAATRKPLVPLVFCLVGALAFSAPSAFEDASLRAISLLAGAALLWASLRAGTRPSVGLFPKDSFRLKTVLGSGFWVLFLMSYAHALGSVYLAYVAINLWQHEPTFAGFIVVTMPLAWSFVAMLIGSLRSARLREICLHYGPYQMVPGCALLGLGLATGNWGEMLLGQILIGSAFGMSWAGISQAAMEAAPEEERKMTGALLPTVATLGSAAGAGASGTVAAVSDLVAQIERADVTMPMVYLYGLGVVVSLLAIMTASGLRGERR